MTWQELPRWVRILAIIYVVNVAFAGLAFIAKLFMPGGTE